MSTKKSILDAADTTLPTLNYAVALQKQAASIGFDWPEIHGVIEKIHEELEEVSKELTVTNNHERIEDELGDLLFACGNLARHLNIDPEVALKQGCQKFYTRFNAIEQLIDTGSRHITNYSLRELDQLWHLVKQQEPK